MFVDVIKVFNL